MTTTANPPIRASRYTAGAVVLHWTIAALILAQLASGYVMAEVLTDGSADQYALFQLHKSLGITVLLLTVARILWRLFNPPPAEPASVSRLEKGLSHLVHFAFYALLLLVPLAGWVVISVSPVRIETVLFFVEDLPWPDLPVLGGLAAPTREAIEGIALETHELLAWAMLALLVLHVAGAVKHQLQDGAFIQRMSLHAGSEAPRRARGRAVSILATVLLFAAIVGSEWLARHQGAPAGAATAPETAPAVEGPAPLWTVVGEESAIRYAFRYEKDTVTGTLPAFDATIRFDPRNLEGSSIAASIDLSAVTVADGGLTVAQIRGANGLAASKEPTATFRADTVTAGEGGGYVAEGELTVRGVTQAVALPFTLSEQGDRTLAHARVALDRKAFGFGDGAGLSEETLAPSVEVEIEILALTPDGMPLVP